jgi:DNA helicase HerA-like ATPase
MRFKTRLADKRWSIFTNYEALGIKNTMDWFKSLGFTAKASKVTVIDLSMLAHEVLPFICATIGRVLLEAREKLAADQRFHSPWVIVLEEAHNYARPARQDEDRGQAQSRKAFERIAKEGRKFGLSLIVASQRPSEISPTIISQCANFFSHRLQNPDDIDHFRRIIPKQAQRLLDQVTVLASGEAIVFGSAVHVPSRVQIKIPSQEPSSVTSAPYADWGRPQNFPINEVLKAWGISEPADPH